MTVSLSNAISGSSLVTLYGDDINEPLLNTDSAKKLGSNLHSPKTVLVRSFEIGGNCRWLPVPVIFVVDGDGKAVRPDMKCGYGSSKYWQVDSLFNTTIVDITEAPLIDLLDEVETRGIKGGLRFEDVRYENGKVRGTIHAWAEIKVFGQKVSFDERINFSIPIQGCHTIYDIGFARLELCIKAPNQLCAQLCVGKWGLEKCWNHCLTVPLAAEEQL